LFCWPATRCTGYPPSRPAGKQLLSGRPLPGIVPGGRPALQGNPVAGQSSGNFYPGWRPHGKRARDSRLSRVRQPCGQLGGMWHGGRGAASSAPTHAGHHRCTSCEPSASWEAAAADDMTAAQGGRRRRSRLGCRAQLPARQRLECRYQGAQGCARASPSSPSLPHQACSSHFFRGAAAAAARSPTTVATAAAPLPCYILSCSCLFSGQPSPAQPPLVSIWKRGLPLSPLPTTQVYSSPPPPCCCRWRQHPWLARGCEWLPVGAVPGGAVPSSAGRGSARRREEPGGGARGGGGARRRREETGGDGRQAGGAVE